MASHWKWGEKEHLDISPVYDWFKLVDYFVDNKRKLDNAMQNETETWFPKGADVITMSQNMIMSRKKIEIKDSEITEKINTKGNRTKVRSHIYRDQNGVAQKRTTKIWIK